MVSCRLLHDDRALVSAPCSHQSFFMPFILPDQTGFRPSGSNTRNDENIVSRKRCSVRNLRQKYLSRLPPSHSGRTLLERLQRQGGFRAEEEV